MKSKSFFDIEITSSSNIHTGNKLFDEWFSKDGGIVPGSIVFVTGTSGAGKTTLMVNLMNWLKNHKSSLYSREMTISSLKQQVKDYNFKNNNAYFVDEEDCPHLNDYIKELETLKPDFVIVDSLQAIATADFPDYSEEKGSIVVREILTKWCKENGSTLFIIGHNTKDNEFAGKNTNMQMVDAHMVMEYDQKTETRRIYWGKKNRKGPMGQLFYTINNGSIEFHSVNPNYDQENLSFFKEFESFVNSFIAKLNPNDTSYSSIVNELQSLSKEVYSRNKNNEYGYMLEFMSAVYKVMSKYGYK